MLDSTATVVGMDSLTLMLCNLVINAFFFSLSTDSVPGLFEHIHSLTTFIRFAQDTLVVDKGGCPVATCPGVCFSPQVQCAIHIQDGFFRGTGEGAVPEIIVEAAECERVVITYRSHD